MFQLLTLAELSGSMEVILEMPQYVTYLKMLFKPLLNSVQSLTILTFCAQCMCLAALLIEISIKIYKCDKMAVLTTIIQPLHSRCYIECSWMALFTPEIFRGKSIL